MKLLHRLERMFAPNSMHRQLYPPPSIPIRFRPYKDSDHGIVLELHDSNAPDRFPQGHRPVFEKFLDSKSPSFFVAESEDSGVIACGGVCLLSECVNVLCYGIVAPRFQGMGVGSAMTLARLAFATRNDTFHFSIIYAVPKSIGFYARLGYSEKQKWKGGDGKDYPVGVLGYDGKALTSISKILRQRNHLIDSTLPIEKDPAVSAIIREVGPDTYSLELTKRHQIEPSIPDEQKAE